MAFNPDVYRHPDVLGAGAKKRRELSHSKAEDEHAVMGEFKRGTLRSGSGKHVTNRKQAEAIAISEADHLRKALGGD
jgi:hypothetical protein